MMQRSSQPRCRCRIGPGRFEVKARVERFVEPAVLVLLAEHESHGYDLAEGLEALLDEGRVDFGNLYRLLRSLEAEGLLRSSWSDDAPGPLKRRYALTDEGWALLEAWTGSLRATQHRVSSLLERYDAVSSSTTQSTTQRKEQQ